jgi:hypothetical protein
VSDIKSKFQQALASAKTVAKNIATNQDLTVSDKLFDERFTACRGCDRFERRLERCDECGCFMRVKARLTGMKCPLDRWPTEGSKK